MSLRQILIDTDTASDDAVAIIMALKNESVEVKAITTIAGNIPVEQATQNAYYTRDLCDSNVPIYQGVAKPLLRPLHTAQFVHGDDGLGDVGLPLSGYTIDPNHAVNKIIDVVQQSKDQIEIVCLGPLTNIALAISIEPIIVKKIKQLFIMGGSGLGPGNITPVSEYNIWADPDAAQIVLNSGAKITMIGWDVTLKEAWFDQETIRKIEAVNSKLSKFILDIQTKRILFEKDAVEGVTFHLADPIAMAVALNPSIVSKAKDYFIECVLHEDTTRGQLILHEENHESGEPLKPNATVVFETNREVFLQMIYQTIK